MSEKIGNMNDNTHLSSPTQSFILLEFLRTLNAVDFEFEFQFDFRSVMNELNIDSYATNSVFEDTPDKIDAALPSLYRRGGQSCKLAYEIAYLPSMVRRGACCLACHGCLLLRRASRLRILSGGERERNG